MSETKTTEYMPSLLLGYILIEMNKAGITRNIVATRMRELGYSKRTVYRFFEQDEHGRFREDVPIEDGQNLLEVVNALLIENNGKPLLFTARGARKEDEEGFNVYTAMRELVEHLIPLLDARSMRELAYHAWSLYKTEYPECPEFFEFDLHPRERRLPPSWMKWEQLTSEEQNRLTNMYQEAKARAEAQVGYHARAERLHHDAEIIAGDRSSDGSGVEPVGAQWAAWEQSKENDMAQKLDCLRWWYDTCPGSEEYDSERQHLKEQIAQLEDEMRRAKESQ